MFFFLYVFLNLKYKTVTHTKIQENIPKTEDEIVAEDEELKKENDQMAQVGPSTPKSDIKKEITERIPSLAQAVGRENKGIVSLK